MQFFDLSFRACFVFFIVYSLIGLEAYGLNFLGQTNFFKLLPFKNRYFLLRGIKQFQLSKTNLQVYIDR